MGVRLSKPKIRRRRLRSRSSSKRQAPEGQSCPASVPVAASGGEDEKRRKCAGACPCNKPHYDVTEEGARGKDSPRQETRCIKDPPSKLCQDTDKHHKDEATATLPTTKEDNSILPPLHVRLPSRDESVASTNQTPSKEHKATDTSETGDTEWTISLGDSSANKSRDEQLLRLMSSIRDALNTGMDQCPSGNQRVRVRLSVTPERHSRSRLVPQNDDVTQSLRHRSPSRGAENEEDKLSSPSAHRNSTRRSPSPPHESNRVVAKSTTSDRRKHYRQIPGDERDVSPCTKPTAMQPKSRSRSRERHRVCPSRHHRPCKGAGERHKHTSSNSRRCRSAFDQRFQEAMFLKLSELQRQTDKEAAELAAAGGRSCVSLSSSESSDSECSGEEDGHVLGGPRSPGSNATNQVTRIFEPLSSDALEVIAKGNETQVEQETGKPLVSHHLHRHESGVGGVATPLASWERRQPNAGLNARRKLTKTRKKSASNPPGKSPHHGYMRLAPGAAFPHTPRLDAAAPPASGDGKSPEAAAVQRHRHEHIHHHYYYNNCSGAR